MCRAFRTSKQQKCLSRILLSMQYVLETIEPLEPFNHGQFDFFEFFNYDEKILQKIKC